MPDKLTPEQVVRLLRAKAAELEHIAKQRLPEATDMYGVEYTIADLALLYDLVADVAERLRNLEGSMVPVGDPLFNEDGTPWTNTP
jgi:hypothetical protein